MLELDVHLTKDNIVVVSHDLELERTTDVKKLINQLDYNEMPLIKNNLTVDFNPGVSYFNFNINADRKIPTLENIFKKFPTIPINIDLKDNDDELIENVANLIQKYNRSSITVWGNINKNVGTKIYEKNPNVNIFFTKQRIGCILFLYYSGLLPFIPIKETHLEIFHPMIFNKGIGIKSISSKPYLVKIIEFFMIKKSLFEHLQKRGIHVYLWVLNNEDEFQSALDLGVDGIMTDYPSKLTNYLNKINQTLE